MDSKFLLRKISAGCLIALVLFIPVLAQDYLSGRVYNGNQGDESTPISGVTVTLYGSGNAGVLGSQISSTSTNGSGWYQLLATSGYEYYTIVESDPSGYQSVAATSVGGSVINSNRIQYSTASQPLSDQTKTGNKFWDKPTASPNNPPVADANGPYTGLVGQSIQLDGTGSYDPDGDALTYAWDLDMDGQYDDATGAQPTHTWNSTYTGNVKLKVTDPDGASDTGVAYVDIDAAQSQTGTVQGTKFNDTNKNGVKDSGEYGMSNWRFYLDKNQNDQYDPGEPYDYSVVSGYSISAAPGTYDLREEEQAGWTASTQVEYSVTIVQDQTVTQDFGNYQASDDHEYDFGDAPPSYDQTESYTLTNNLFLGSIVDADHGPQPHGNALGDDEDGSDDEDGVIFTSAITPGQSATVSVTIGAANIAEMVFRLYLDHNIDGQWDLISEKVVEEQITATGTYNYTYSVPANAVHGVTFARAVLYDAGPVPAWGVPYGEVEDYEVGIGPGGSITIIKEAIPKDDTSFSFGHNIPFITGFTLQDPSSNNMTFQGMGTGTYLFYETVPNGWRSVSIQVIGDMDGQSEIVNTQDSVYIDYDVGEEITVYFINEKIGIEDFGDAPDSYSTLRSNNGASHTIDTLCFMGTGIDAEPDGQPSPSALGDDHNGLPDENGLTIIGHMMPGSPVQICLLLQNKDSNPREVWIAGWIDYNQDGVWGLVGDRVATPRRVHLPPHSVVQECFNVIIPNAIIGTTFARFRMYQLDYDPGDQFVAYPWGDGGVGEVEDYQVTIAREGDTPAAMGDLVWHDLNRNGLQDPGEPGIPNVWVEPWDIGGFPWMGTSTDLSGEYGIYNLPPGQYYLVFHLRRGYSFSPQHQGGDPTIDSDANAMGQTNFITVMSGEFNKSIDAGMYILDDTGGYDFGDAPDPTYPTILASNGARHLIDQTLYLGSTIDSEPNGLTSTVADGDDQDGSNDEDGVTMSPFIAPGQTIPITVVASGQGVVNAWLDFNLNGDWGDAGEHIIAAQPVVAGTNTFTITVPANAGMGLTFARFRFSSVRDLSYTGEAPDGEVEDYAIVIKEAEDGSITVVKQATPKDDSVFWFCARLSSGFFNLFCFPLSDPSNTQYTLLNPSQVIDIGEATMLGWTLKDITITGDTDNGSTIDLPNGSVTMDFDPGENIIITFKNEKTDDGGYDFGDAPTGYPDASHELGGPWFGGLGDAPDAESSQQNDPQARGDDQDGNDDEDGLTHADLVRGQFTLMKFSAVTGNSGVITIAFWVDYNQNGSFSDPGERVGVWSDPHAFPPNWFCSTWGCPFTIPTTAMTGTTYARFRIYEGTNVNISPTGSAGPGEVEDHQVEIKAEGDPIPPGAIVYGAKWNDINGNGKWDTTEPPLANWTIWLDANQNGIEDAGDQYDQTDANGQFTFYGLNTGQYMVGEKLKSGWMQTYPGGPGTQTINVNANVLNPPVLFGNHQTDPDAGEGAVKWNQPPLFDPMSEDTTSYWGWQETSIYSDSYLADNWFCHDPAPVTDIRWWGSYADWDSLFPPDNAPNLFHIGIWTDVPKGMDRDISHPGELIREWFVERSQIQESIMKSHFMPESMAKPLSCFQYTFNIPQDAWFHQENDSTVYWLSIGAVYDEIPDTWQWGWLTRERYFNDDAIRIRQPLEPHPGALFGEGGPIAEFWDLAFKLGTDEYESNYDFGDAPDIAYGTTLSKNGPHHLLNPDVFLGEQIDMDNDGQAHLDAHGDDDDGQDDEDGVEIADPLSIGAQPQFLVTASTNGFLNGWLDMDQDGSWYEPSDHIIQNSELFPGENMVEASVLDEGFEPGRRLARFRFSTKPGLWFKGYAIDGEVEDYVMMIYPATDVAVDKVQAPLKFQLFHNFPNPFNPYTTIEYDVPQKTHVKIVIYNLAGQIVEELVNMHHEPGHHRVMWHGRDASGNPVSSGIYLYLMEAGSYRDRGKLVLIR